MAWFSRDRAAVVSLRNNPDADTFLRVFPFAKETQEQMYVIADLFAKKESSVSICARFYTIITRAFAELSEDVLAVHPILGIMQLGHQEQLRLAAHILAHFAPALGCSSEDQRRIARRLARWDITPKSSPGLSAVCMRQVGKSWCAIRCAAFLVLFCAPNTEVAAKKEKRKGDPDRLGLLYHDDVGKNEAQLASIRQQVESFAEKYSVHIQFVIDRKTQFDVIVRGDFGPILVRVKCATLVKTRGYAPDWVMYDEALMGDGTKIRKLLGPMFKVPGRSILFLSSPPEKADPVLLNFVTRDSLPFSTVFTSSSVCNSIECNRNVTSALACNHLHSNQPPWCTTTDLRDCKDKPVLDFVREERGWMKAIQSKGFPAASIESYCQRRIKLDKTQHRITHVVIFCDPDHGSNLGEFAITIMAALRRSSRPANERAFPLQYVVSSSPVRFSPVLYHCAHPQRAGSRTYGQSGACQTTVARVCPRTPNSPKDMHCRSR
jgi:hypothetical protein